jgi:SAM-dependent methyltransferase
MKPPGVHRARVLEIGCGSGANLIPMAVELPEGSFLGIDQSARHVAQGHAMIEAGELKNVELRHASILDVGPELGTFDYIICHGVFSWVAPQVQQRILSLCTATLAPDGVAYVSYNTLPGWHMRGILREAMLFHLDGEADPRQSIRKAPEVLDFLVQLPWGPENYDLTMLKDMRAAIVREDGS